MSNRALCAAQLIPARFHYVTYLKVPVYQTGEPMWDVYAPTRYALSNRKGITLYLGVRHGVVLKVEV